MASFCIALGIVIALPTIVTIFCSLRRKVKLSLSTLRVREGNQEKKQRIHTNYEEKKKKSDKFTLCNREKSNIAIAIFEFWRTNYFLFWVHQYHFRRLYVEQHMLTNYVLRNFVI